MGFRARHAVSDHALKVTVAGIAAASPSNSQARVSGGACRASGGGGTAEIALVERTVQGFPEHVGIEAKLRAHEAARHAFGPGDPQPRVAKRLAARDEAQKSLRLGPQSAARHDAGGEVGHRAFGFGGARMIIRVEGWDAARACVPPGRIAASRKRAGAIFTPPPPAPRLAARRCAARARGGSGGSGPGSARRRHRRARRWCGPRPAW